MINTTMTAGESMIVIIFGLVVIALVLWLIGYLGEDKKEYAKKRRGGKKGRKSKK